jgi:quinol monooxygenase YgiN
MTENSVRVVAGIKAKTGRASELRAILSSMIEPIRNEKGCISYEMLENRNDPTDFTFVEEWSSDEALQIHLDGIQSNLPKLLDLIAEPPDIRSYSVVN